MNAENILKVADAIENHSVPGLAFHMNYTFEDDKEEIAKSFKRFSPDQNRMGDECGAVACFIGWTNSVIPGDGLDDGKAAGFKLGFEDWSKATELFYPDTDEWPNLSYDKVTPEQAVRVLRHFAATGEIDWTL